MSSKKVLDVGQCNMDHTRISEVLNESFNVEVLRAHSNGEAIEMAKQDSFDLILINRLFDRDGSPGMDTLTQLKSDTNLSEVPVMVVSNFEDAQNAAVAAGAVPGFGKAALNEPAGTSATVALLSEFLGTPNQ
ncbi:MAG: response regulator [Mariniblastus sp.]